MSVVNWVILVVSLALPPLVTAIGWWRAKVSRWPVQRVQGFLTITWLLVVIPLFWTMYANLPQAICGPNWFVCDGSVLLLITLITFTAMFTVVHFMDREFRGTDWSLAEGLSYRLRGLALDFLAYILILTSAIAVYTALSHFAINKNVMNILGRLITPTGILGVSVAYPQLLTLFMRGKPLPDGHLREEVNLLLSRANLRVNDIILLPGRRGKIANAWVAGALPANRSLFLTEYLLDQLSLEEIRAIVAHELGHLHHRHLQKHTLLNLIWCIIFGLVFAGVAQVITLTLASALITGMALGLIWTLLFGVISRRSEFEADRFAAILVGDPETVIKALSRLQVPMAKAEDEATSRWLQALQTHPTLSERVKNIRAAFT